MCHGEHSLFPGFLRLGMNPATIPGSCRGGSTNIEVIVLLVFEHEW
jgi:hypothetical protein